MAVSGFFTRSAVAGLTSLVLVVTLVTPVHAEPVEVLDEVTLAEIESIPPIESPEVILPPSEVPEGDFDLPAGLGEVPPEPTAEVGAPVIRRWKGLI